MFRIQNHATSRSTLMALPISICFLWLLALSPGTALRIGEWVPPTVQYSISEVIPESPAVNTIEAIEKVKKGIGSVWIHHTTHNAGTSLLALFQNHGLKWDPESRKKEHGCFINEEDLAANPGTLFYDDICGEAGLHGDDAKDFGKAFSRTSAKLVTVYPFRNPMVRILSHDRPGHNWNEQPDGCFTDNYGLRMLLGMDFNTTITKEHIQAAKARAASFDILADATNFTETLMVICGSFGWECTNNKPELDQQHVDKVKKFAQEHPSLWKTWEKRNAPELEFYEFAKGLVKTRLELANHQQSLHAVPRVPSEPMALHYVEEHSSWICPQNKGGSLIEATFGLRMSKRRYTHSTDLENFALVGHDSDSKDDSFILPSNETLKKLANNNFILIGDSNERNAMMDGVVCGGADEMFRFIGDPEAEDAISVSPLGVGQHGLVAHLSPFNISIIFLHFMGTMEVSPRPEWTFAVMDEHPERKEWMWKHKNGTLVSYDEKVNTYWPLAIKQHLPLNEDRSTILLTQSSVWDSMLSSEFQNGPGLKRLPDDRASLERLPDQARLEFKTWNWTDHVQTHLEMIRAGLENSGVHLDQIIWRTNPSCYPDSKGKGWHAAIVEEQATAMRNLAKRKEGIGPGVTLMDWRKSLDAVENSMCRSESLHNSYHYTPAGYAAYWDLLADTID